MEVSIKQVNESDFNVTCDVVPEDIQGKVFVVKPRRKIEHGEAMHVYQSLSQCFPNNPCVILPHDFDFCASSPESAIDQLEDLVRRLQEFYKRKGKQG